MKIVRGISLAVIAAILLSSLTLIPQLSLAEQQLPDLVIVDVWDSGSQICYTLKNIGQGSVGSAAAPATFYNALFIDDLQQPVEMQKVSDITLEPGEQVNRCFNYQWQMTQPQHTIEVCADWGQNMVDESNEGNNCLQEIWTQALPDLVVERIECGPGNKLAVTIKNIGSVALPAGWTALANLYFDGNEIGFFDLGSPTSTTGGGIANPGGSSYYLLAWDITGQVTVLVNVDFTNSVTEFNEQNNSDTEVIAPAPTPTPTPTPKPMPTPTPGATPTPTPTPTPTLLRITSGPNVYQITQTSATVCWDTDQDGNSVVSYDNRSGKYESISEDQMLVRQHCLDLTGLEPATTYHFTVESTDSSGNRVRSNDLSFDTLSPPDEQRPSLSLQVPDTLSGEAVISADVWDNIGVDRVVFLLDGKPMYTDFSAPFKWEFNTLGLDEGDRTLAAQAFDVRGNTIEVKKESIIRRPPIDPTAPAITFVNPHHGDNVSGSVRIESLIEDPAGYLREAEMYIDGVLVRRWVYTPFTTVLSEGEIELVPNPPTSSLSFIYLWDTTGLDFDSEHLIEVRAQDDSDNHAYNSVQVRKPPLEALFPDLIYTPPDIIDFEVTRNVVRGTNGNWFEVWLNITNTGNVAVGNLQIRDACAGFQAIALSPDTTVDYSHFYEESLITIIPTMGELRPGETWTFLYHVVPILFSPYNPLTDDEYVIGLSRSGWRPQVLCMHGGDTYQHFIELPYTPAHEDLDGDGRNELDTAFKSADYLIVTSEVLLRDADFAGVDLLLQKAATLAREKRGVVGYWYPSPYAYGSWQYAYTQIKEYITPGVTDSSSNRGYWASRLSDAFSHPDVQDAYLLILGEWGVIPSPTYNVRHLDIRWRGGDRTDTVRLTDNYFADTVGNDKVPDLIVGRIIGNTPQALIKPIEASLEAMMGRGFDRVSAVVLSGYEDGSGDSFVHNAQNAAGDLVDQGISCDILHWGNFIEHGWGLPLTDYDAFALGDVDGDGIDEVIIAKDEESKIYIYEPADRSLVGEFACEFTRYDGLATGNLNRDAEDEIVIARDDDSTIYVYEANGDLIDSCSARFSNWDAVATGDVLGDSKDEVITVSKRWDNVKIFKLIDARIWGREGWELREEDTWELDIDFTSHDSFAVGNVLGDVTSKDELVIARNDNNEIYLYQADGRQLVHFDARFTRYDGLAIGDVDDDTMDEMVVIIDEDDKVYIYDDNGRYYDTDEGEWTWRKSRMYSRFLDDWFHGIRYTASDTRHDGFAIGSLIPGENPKIAILHIRDGWGSFGVLTSTWSDADEWANERLSRYAADISIVAVSGHGNPGGASPIGCSLSHLWGDFLQHPFVFSMSCLTGDYGGVSFGECLFDHGAAVLIGSTEVSACSSNNETIRKYFDDGFGHYWNVWGERAGKAFTEYERRRATQGNWWKFWVYEYNYYGDPKFPTGG